MRTLLTAALALSMVWLGAAATQQSKATSKKGPTAAAKKGTTPAASRRSAASSRKGGAKRPATTWRNRQTAPNAERYREIQSALVARGYLDSSQATGVWNQSSIDALKKFQAEQNLNASGKINSLSLIALGLGPKRDSAAAAIPPKPQLDEGPGH